jgi:ABC-2 type transport system permease protein
MIDAIRSEWIKISTITVTWVLVIVAVAFPLVITLLTAGFGEDGMDGEEFASMIAGTAVVTSMLLGVVASLGITNEFSHGTIRPTFAALPDRTRPLLAKPIVHVTLSLVVTSLVVVVGWVAGTAIAEGTQQLSDDGAQAALVGVVLLAIGLALLGYGLGLLVRNSAATICLLLLWPLVAEGLIAGLMSAIGVEGLQRWLPYVAGINMVSTDVGSDTLGRVNGGIYFFAWVAAVLALGVWTAKRRDA